MRPGVRIPCRPPIFWLCSEVREPPGRPGCGSAFRMRKPFQSSPALRWFCVVSLATLSLFNGCGKLRRWYARVEKRSDTPHSVTITWTASKSAVAGYYVYRFSAPNDLARVSPGIVSSTQYIDRTVAGGKTYTYYVKSVDLNGIESVPSEKITVTVPRRWFLPSF
jgi:hypothetical protein